MQMTASKPLDPWFRALEQRDRTISDAEKAALTGVIEDRVEIAEGRDLVRAHARPTRSTLLLEGWAARYIDLPDGRRQIVALHLPGDFIDLHSFPLHVMDHSALALTDCVVGYAPHVNLRRLSAEQPHLTRILWLSTLIDGAIMRQWLFSAGQRSAIERLAHLVCELKARLKIIGRDGTRLTLPLTQTELGQVLGITPIHVNRIVQELRRTELLTWRGAELEILNEPKLLALAKFDPTYLHLESETR